MITLMFAHTCGFSSPMIGVLATVYYIPMFFILSGYTYRKSESIIIDIRKRSKRLLKAYFSFSIINLCIWSAKSMVLNTFTAKAFTTSLLGILYSRNEIMKDGSFPIPVGDHSTLWFFTAMVLTTIVFIIVLQKWPAKIINKFIFVAAAVMVTFLLGKLPIFLPWCADAALLGACFHLFGYFCKEYKAFEDLKSRKTIFMILISTVVYISLCFVNNNINYSTSQFGGYGPLGITLFMLQGITGTLPVIYACKMIQNTFIGNIMSTIGRHTVIIFSMHLPLFDLLNYLFEKYFNIEPITYGVLNFYAVLKIVTVIAVLVLADILINRIKTDTKKLIRSSS